MLGFQRRWSRKCPILGELSSFLSPSLSLKHTLTASLTRAHTKSPIDIQTHRCAFTYTKCSGALSSLAQPVFLSHTDTSVHPDKRIQQALTSSLTHSASLHPKHRQSKRIHSCNPPCHMHASLRARKHKNTHTCSLICDFTKAHTLLTCGAHPVHKLGTPCPQAQHTLLTSFELAYEFAFLVATSCTNHKPRRC